MKTAAGFDNGVTKTIRNYAQILKEPLIFDNRTARLGCVDVSCYVILNDRRE